MCLCKFFRNIKDGPLGQNELVISNFQLFLGDGKGAKSCDVHTLKEISKRMRKVAIFFVLWLIYKKNVIAVTICTRLQVIYFYLFYIVFYITYWNIIKNKEYMKQAQCWVLTYHFYFAWYSLWGFQNIKKSLYVIQSTFQEGHFKVKEI